MTSALVFGRNAQILNGRRVRRGMFRWRSCLPVSAACVVANGVRETLATLLCAPVSLRLLEPSIPTPPAWAVICAGAQLYGVCGPVADAAFVLRSGDAQALAASAFGEAPGDARPLSPLESEVVVRALRAISGCLGAVCGRETSALERILDISDYATYFELLVERPASLRLGVALSRDPSPRASQTLSIADLMDVQIEVSAEFARGELSGAAFLDLRPGTDVPMKTRVGEQGLLKAGAAVLGHGECGALGERNALIVSATHKG